MDLKERIKQARKSAMLSQSQLAQALGMGIGRNQSKIQ